MGNVRRRKVGYKKVIIGAMYAYLISPASLLGRFVRNILVFLFNSAKYLMNQAIFLFDPAERIMNPADFSM